MVEVINTKTMEELGYEAVLGFGIMQMIMDDPSNVVPLVIDEFINMHKPAYR